MGGVRGCGLAVFALAVMVTTKVGAGQAADVVYAHGDVRVMDAAGAAQPVRRGMAVQSGQTLVTGQGRLQMRMADGGFIALQPDTQFRIDEYNYAGAEDGSERSFFDLVKGGIRFITGAIGHRNKENFRIKTAVATIGIRGSAGRANVCVGGSCGGYPDGVYVTGNQDTLTLQNEKDAVDIEPGETYFTDCAACDIREVDAGPNAYAAVTPGEGEQEEDKEGEGEGEGAPGVTPEGGYAAGDQRDTEGDLLGVPESPGPAAPASGDLVASVVGGGSAAKPELGFLVGVDKNPPTAITGVEGSSGVVHSAVLGTATVKDSYSSANGALFLARWGGGTYTDIQDGVSKTETLSGEQGLHFAYGTSATVSESALSSGAVAFYDLAAFTAPTRASGSGAPGVVRGGTLAVNFSTEPSAQLSGMTVTQGGANYTVSTGPMAILLLSTSGGGVNPVFTDTGTAIGSTSACVNGCGVDIAGFLSGSVNSTIGTIPSHAGLTYTIQDSDPLSGAAGFEFNGEVSLP